MRAVDLSFIRNEGQLSEFGLEPSHLIGAVNHTYQLFESVDEALVNGGSVRLGGLVELANLSAIIGNVFRTGLISSTNGVYRENAPHTFPDLLSNEDGVSDLEIKVALEKNNPKGHLVKPGPHLILRYSLGGPNCEYLLGKDNRGVVPWLWEIKMGTLLDRHFSVSNTEGDSGKTAVIIKEGMDNLKTVFLDERFFPYGRNGSVYKAYKSLFSE